MRFQELRDADGTMLAQGLHPSIAVVAAGAVPRAAAISAVVSAKGCKIIHPSDVDDELKRAAVAAIEQHDRAVENKKAKVAEAERALQEATDVAMGTTRDTSVATADLSRFDDLATRLAAAEESYEAAVRADGKQRGPWPPPSENWTGSWASATAPAPRSNRRASPGTTAASPRP